MADVSLVSSAAALASLATHPVPTGPGYSLLLVLHVASAVVGFGAVAASGVQAAAAARGPGSRRDDSVRRYFRPGANVVARALYVVPLSGAGLIAVSNGAFAASDPFVVAGLTLWCVAAVVAEAALWPAERRVQALVTDDWHEAATSGALAGHCRRVVVASGVLVVVFVVAVVLMVGRS